MTTSTNGLHPPPLVRPKPGTITIEFGAESDYEGVIVTLTKRVSLAAALEMADRFTDVTAAAEVVRLIGDEFILGWNLADEAADGTLIPAPVSGERLLAEGYEFGTRIARTFIEVLGTLDPPTPPPSTAGPGSAAALTETGTS